MDKKNQTYNNAKAKVENKQNSEQDFSVEFGKENTFDAINLTHSQGSKNSTPKTKAKDTEFGLDDSVKTNNKKSVSRNKKNNRHGNKNRQNNN